MNVERPLQICVALMAIFGTGLLGLEKRDPTLPVTVMFASVTSVIFTDWLGWFSLHPILANLAALASMVFTVNNVLGQPTEAQLLTVADLLVYLQIILLYQVKTSRRYWQLMALSLLQVVVAAALNLVFVFGILLTAYLFVALTALSLFFVHRETAAGGGVFGHSAPPRGAPAVVVPVIGPMEPPRRESRVARRLAGQASWMGLITLTATIVVFFLLPRHEAIWKRKQPQRQRMVGFTDEVNLDDLGPILESPETVMRISFTEYISGRPYHVWSDPYFRGAILAAYTPGRGRWVRAPHNVYRPGLQEAKRDFARLVQQEVIMEGDDHRILFSVMPAFAIDRTPRHVRFDPLNELLLVNDTEEAGEDAKTRYVIATDAFERGIQRAMRPAFWTPDHFQLQDYTRFDEPCREALPGLAQLAEEILAKSRAASDDLLGRARALEAHFLSAGRYTYSLDNTKRRDPTKDPIEDFVTNHRSGHCEYFASALTLMLRSQNIPARLVVGYKGGEFNTVGNYYQVRQLHAHAWVEVYLSAEQIAQLNVRSPELYPRGAWLRLDPTPLDPDPLVGLPGSGIVSWFAHWADYAQLLWNDYVLGMNPERQRRAIYDPLVTSARATWRGLLSPHAWELRLVAIAERLHLDRLAERRVDWQLLLITLPVAIVMLAVGYVVQGMLVRGATRLWKHLRYPLSHGRRTDSLLRRMERRLARYGLRRPPSQTPLEFARFVQQQLPGAPPPKDVPSQVVDAFYRSRYGGRTLDSQFLDQLQHDLAKWERGLDRRASS